MGLQVRDEMPELGMTVGEALLAVHRSYLPALKPLLQEDRIRALAHITGGGIPGNLPRVLGNGLGARVRLDSWEIPPLFRILQRGGGVSLDEMFRVFNMGVGMIAITAPEAAEPALRKLTAAGEKAWILGDVLEGNGVELT